MIVRPADGNDVTAAGPTGAETLSAVDERLAAVCQGLTVRLDELAIEIAEKLRAELPHFAAAMAIEELVPAVHQNIEGLIESVRLNRTLSVPGPHNTGLLRAEQEMPLETVLSGFRIGVIHIWQELVLGCEEADRETFGADGPAPASRALLMSASVLWTTFEKYSQEIAKAYQTFAAERQQRNHRRRQALLTMLFSGEPGHDQTLVDVANQLQFPTAGTFVVLMTEHSAPDTDTPETARTSLAGIGLQSVWKSEARSDIGLIAVAGQIDILRITEHVSRLKFRKVGVSRPFSGLSAVPAAVAQARIASNAGREGRHIVTHFDDAQVAGLLISSPALAAGLQQHVFGAIQEMSNVDQDLLIGTLRAWFDNGGHPESAATELHCHPNTVRYRLNRLMSALNRDLKTPLDVVHLFLAAEARRLQVSGPIQTSRKTPPENPNGR